MDERDHEGSGRSYVCYYLNQISSRGLPFGDNPLGYSLPSFLLQFSLVSMVTRLVQLILRPIGQPSTVAQILGGVLLGPSVLGRMMPFFAKAFPRKSRLVLDTVSVFGFMLLVFLIGVKTDLSTVVKSGRKALVVGILGFFVPLGLTGLVAFLLNEFLSLDHDVARALPHVVFILSMTAFPVVTCFLDELKILNSEIGRLASSSSIVCDVCLWFVTCIDFMAELAKTNSLKVIIGSCVSAGLFIIIVVLVIRPAALWVSHHTPETRPVKETYIFLALVTVMACGLAGEVIGIHATTASFVLGLIVPDGPPLGAALVETLDCFVSLMLLPLFLAVSGLNVDIFHIQNLKNVGVLQLVVLVAFIGKLMGSMLPLIVCRMPFRDALSLGLIMNSKGIVELAFLNEIKNHNIVTEEIYAIMIVSVVATTGLISPIVKFLYDPSKRFVAYKRRTLLHSRSNDELRILACIHQQEDVHSIISLLQVSNTTRDSPINLVVLHLVKLTARASSLLIAHRQRDKPPRNPTESERIFNAFKTFEQHYPGFFRVHCYKGISPFMTMHNDVCTLAQEKRTTLIILPFRKQWTSGDTMQSSRAYRHLNKCVFDQAPCSVGILIDHRIVKSPYVITEHSAFRVVLLFFGGVDDREALAYAQRMSDHTCVRLTVLRFTTPSPIEIVGGTERSKILDADILTDFKLRTQHTEDITYREKTVTSGMDVIMVARSVVNAYNLVMVGRRHGDSPIMLQLAKWNERGELGAIGELLAASELKGEASILVVQQQTRVWGLRDPEESTHLEELSYRLYCYLY
ncbi:cation/H(+) antiporter 15-like [Sesamum indicum]|uniref:Cation/H(+) antiporter 15-like n=1 Tax=Sesamum indicum TaxID=4182 RepID=A0A6I9T8W6_SESIN|nr:cation/H(+) antiporter 15-like [Sesamum indicum]